jgi:hypothetical protein
MSPDEYRQWAAQLRDEAEGLEAQARALRERAAELENYATQDEQSPPTPAECFRRLFG